MTALSLSILVCPGIPEPSSYQEQETVWGSLYYGSMVCPRPCVLVNSGVPSFCASY